MVRIIDFKTIKSEAGKEFNMLIVQGGIETMISKNTGRTYLTARKATVSSTFDASTCKSLIGSELSGTIHKVTSEPYEYIVPETGEVLILNHSWQYLDNDLANAKRHIINEEIVN